MVLSSLRKSKGNIICTTEEYKTNISNFPKGVRHCAKIDAQKPIKLKTTCEIVVLPREIVYT